MGSESSRQNGEAVLWVTIATALFSLVFASQKFAGDTASALQILFLRYVGGFATLLCVVRFRNERLRHHASNRPAEHLLRAVFGGFGGVAIIHASANMPIVDATGLSLLSVVFMIGLGMLFFRERIGCWRGAGILLCFAGAAAIMLSRGAFRQFDPTYILPALIATFGALLVALEGVMIKRLSHAEKPITVLLYVNAFGVVLMAIPALATWRSPLVTDNLPFLLLGPLAISAQYLVIRGYRMADISVVGPVDYSWLIFAALIGLIFFGETLTIGSVAGSALIGLGGVVLAHRRSGAAVVSANKDVRH